MFDCQILPGIQKEIIPVLYNLLRKTKEETHLHLCYDTSTT